MIYGLALFIRAPNEGRVVLLSVSGPAFKVDERLSLLKVTAVVGSIWQTLKTIEAS